MPSRFIITWRRELTVCLMWLRMLLGRKPTRGNQAMVAQGKSRLFETSI